MRVELLTLLILGLGSLARGQPPPPSVAADWREIIPSETREECRSRCRVRGEYEVCAATLCVEGRFPLKTILGVDLAVKRAGDTITIQGDFGVRRNDQIMGLVTVENPTRGRRPAAPKLSMRHRIRIERWTDHVIVAQIHDRVRSGVYRIVLLYEVNQPGMSPVLKQGSNLWRVDVR